MDIKETFIRYLQDAGFDTMTACKMATRARKEIRRKMSKVPIGTTLKYCFRENTFTVKKVEKKLRGL